jgi:hypothetical protein
MTNWMASAARGALATLAIVAVMAGLTTIPVIAQSPIDVHELADYRLTTEIFERFVQANGRMVDITQDDSAFIDAPLFTKDVALSGDAVAEAAGLVARLANHAGLAAALGAAKLTPREYTKFAMTLIAAHLAYRFMNAGVLLRVPPGAPTINVEFVRTHEPNVTAALASLGIRD